jgi:hypothetical protein
MLSRGGRDYSSLSSSLGLGTTVTSEMCVEGSIGDCIGFAFNSVCEIGASDLRGLSGSNGSVGDCIGSVVVSEGNRSRCSGIGGCGNCRGCQVG